MNALQRTASALLVLAACVFTFAGYDDVRLQAAVQGLLAFCAR